MRHQLICVAVAVFAALSLSLPALTIADEVETPQAQSTRPDPMQLARGARSWSRECGRCHNLRSPSELSDEEWDVSVTHMRVRANIPGDEAEDIIAFLKASNN